MGRNIKILAGICEEFTENILVDEESQSIIFNVEEKWFDVLHDQLIQSGMTLAHKTKLKDTYSCTFLLRH